MTGSDTRKARFAVIRIPARRKRPPPRPSFRPGPRSSPRSLRSDGPGYPLESRFSKKTSSANSKNLQKACLFASSIRGEEPSSRPRGPDRGRFSRGFSLRAGRSDGVGYSKGSISSRTGFRPVEKGPPRLSFRPGPRSSPRSLPGDGPGYPLESRFSKKTSSGNSKTLFGEFENPLASSTRGEEPSSRPRGPDRGRFSKGFSLRAGRSDGVGYSKGSISTRAGSRPVEKGPPAARLFGPGHVLRPGPSGVTGPDAPSRAVFGKKPLRRIRKPSKKPAFSPPRPAGRSPHPNPEDLSRVDFREDFR